MECEVCGLGLQDGLHDIDLGLHPLCDDLVAKTNPSGAGLVNSYKQTIRLCPRCLTAHQLFPVEKELLFKPDYKYRSGLTKDVVDGMEGLVAEVIRRTKLTESSVVLDVGCNDGSLLGIFKARTGAMTIGVDPTDAIKNAEGIIDQGIQAFFDKEVAQQILDRFGSPDVITFTNVFAHIENLPKLLQAVKILMSDKTLLVVENHYLGSILDRKQFDTFYHEHPRTYSATSFKYVAETLGVSIEKIEFPERYGGNIRVFLTKRGSLEEAPIPAEESLFPSKFSDLQRVFNQWLVDSKVVLGELRKNGVLIGKGLPGRAVMLISSLGLDAQEMPIVYEQPRSPKVGHFVPGTSIVVESDDALPRDPDQTIIIWAWHIADEVKSYLEALGVPGHYWVPLPMWEEIAIVR